MTTVVVPPADDMNGMARLLDNQAGHFDDLRKYADRVCDNTAGMDQDQGSAMYWIVPAVHALSATSMTKLQRCSEGMQDAADKVRRARRDYTESDHYSAEDIAASFLGRVTNDPSTPNQQPPGFFPDIEDETPFLPRKDYKDVSAPKLADPAEPSDELGYTFESVKGRLGQLEEAWSELTAGESLLKTIIEPITGNTGRLLYLSEGYKTAMDASYDIAGNMRSGTLLIAPEWNAVAGRAFEWFMFRWHMGVGGLGDVYSLISQGFTELHGGVKKIVEEILNKANMLIDKYLNWLAQKLKEIPDLHYRICGPKYTWPWDHRWKDVMEASERLYKAAKVVAAIIVLTQKLYRLYEDFKAKLVAWQKRFNDAKEIAKDPKGWAQKLVDEKLNYHRKVIIEKNQGPGWNPALGAWRVGLLPV